MASTKIQELKGALSMGARGNKYKIMLAAPLGPTDDFLIDTLGKGGAIPAKSIGQVEVWTQGRKLIVAGDAAFDYSWELTFYNTQDHQLRDQFDQWLLYIDSVEDHKRGATVHADYMTETAKITQLNTTDNSEMNSYEFRNMWPVSISAIDMADDMQDTITEFTVEFAYSHWIKV